MFYCKFSKQIFLNFIILIIVFKLAKTDLCTIKAICECQYQYVNKSIPAEINHISNINNNINLFADERNICSPKPSPKTITSDVPAKQVFLNCTYIDFKVNSTEFKPPEPVNIDSFTLDLQYPCPIKPPVESHYSTGTILIIIFFTIVFSYLGLGIAVNFFLVGARGIEMVPNLDFWRDFPALVLDGVKFIQNGCKARPSDLTSPTGQEGYDAI